ncbi:partial UDP-2-acetamido-2,6-beta-L-arabino-hexul-4-ose reductase, partial [Anaerolineae bacterium]
MQIVSTGAKGFSGKNLAAALRPRPAVTVLEFDQDNRPQDLADMLAAAEWVFHLAGVNRPRDAAEFQTGNVDSTTLVCDQLLRLGRPIPIVLASSS